MSDIKYWIGKEKIIVLKWPRQVGKTTIIKNLKSELDENGYKTLYYSVDKELWNPIFENVKYFEKYIKDQIDLKQDKKAYPKSTSFRAYIFIDEFQYIKNAWLFMKVLFDEFKKDIQFIVSGSSSLEITKNSEFLTGRKIDFYIWHITFYEYISFKSENTYKKIDLLDIEELKYVNDIYKEDIKKYFLEYLNYWGYPEVCVSKYVKDKEIILNEIVSTYIKKDIISFLNIENISAFNNLIKLLSDWVWNLVNKSELANSLNINYETLIRYLDILEWTYIFRFIKPYFTNIRKELSKMPKVFINDTWTLNNILRKKYDTLDILSGNVIENIIYNTLSSKYNLDDIYFYRTISKSEIDFVVQMKNELLPIEVKFRNNTLKVPIAIKNFEKLYDRVKYNLIITKNNLKIEWNNIFIPYYLYFFIK